MPSTIVHALLRPVLLPLNLSGSCVFQFATILPILNNHCPQLVQKHNRVCVVKCHVSQNCMKNCRRCEGQLCLNCSWLFFFPFLFKLECDLYLVHTTSFSPCKAHCITIFFDCVYHQPTHTCHKKMYGFCFKMSHECLNNRQRLMVFIGCCFPFQLCCSVACVSVWVESSAVPKRNSRKRTPATSDQNMGLSFNGAHIFHYSCKSGTFLTSKKFYTHFLG